MPRLLLLIILGLALGTFHGFADAHVVQKFDGVDSSVSTATFTVQDKWEVFWFSPKPMNLTLRSSDGTLVAGVSGIFKGSFYQPKGGTFYFQIDSAHPEMRAPWHILVAEVAGGTNLSPQDAAIVSSSPGEPGYAPPSTVLVPGTTGPASPGTPLPSLTLSPAASTNVAAPAVPPAAAVVGKLTDDQTRAIVLIKGDNAEGTGFLVKTIDGPMVVTNIHVIANNPNLKITTNTGALVTVLSAKGASDRDLAMLSIQDAKYNYLDVSTDISQSVQPGDEVITPGNSEGGEVMLNTTGRVLGIGPERIEIDNPIYHGNSGGPVFHPKSGKVLGVVTEAMKVDVSNDLDKASFASRNSAISGSMRYFGLRLDTVSAWVPIDSNRFQIETTFLDQFHEQSRRLDSYLNTDNKSSKSSNGTSDNNSDAKIYLTDEKIMKANERYIDQASGADTAQQIDAARGLLLELQGIAETDLDQIQDMNNFYSFDQERAKDELDYRKALKAELDAINNNVDRLGHLPRTNN